MQNCFLICFNSGFVNKLGHKYFDRSGPFLQIRSHIVTYKTPRSSRHHAVFITDILMDTWQSYN